MTQEKRRRIRNAKRRLQKARVEWKKANPEAALERSCAAAVEREKRALDRADREGNRADRREAKRRRYAANVALRAARKESARAEVKQAIIKERRNPTLPNPVRASWMNRLRQSFLRHAVKQGA